MTESEQGQCSQRSVPLLLAASLLPLSQGTCNLLKSAMFSALRRQRGLFPTRCVSVKAPSLSPSIRAASSVAVSTLGDMSASAEEELPDRAVPGGARSSTETKPPWQVLDRQPRVNCLWDSAGRPLRALPGLNYNVVNRAVL